MSRSGHKAIIAESVSANRRKGPAAAFAPDSAEEIRPSESDIYLFHEGSLYESYRMMGAHPARVNGVDGVRFVVWAPNAAGVNVVGDFNGWNGRNHPLARLSKGGLWWTFVTGLGEGDLYQYEIVARDGSRRMKADPYAFRSELRPGTASIVHAYDRYEWNDGEWMASRGEQPFRRPVNIYEVHPGTWRIHGRERFYSYDELAEHLVDYVRDMGYTHIELMPISEHPFDRSWGYQVTGYYAATSRYGHPDGLKRLIDRCHRAGIGVILDWVPGHFCRDDHGLRRFDGEPLYEPEDERLADKPAWGTLGFHFGRNEVRSFLISNAIFWLCEYHFDGLRVDAVASLLNLNFDRPSGEWITNRLGGHENLEALSFLRKLNETVFRYAPGAIMAAEDSTAWPLVTAPVHAGGLGFNFKWNMGWMNDVLRYMQLEPIYRKYHHHLMTFSMMYAYSENYILPLSHDEVVHGKRSLLDKMPGSYRDKFAQLRLLYAFLMTHPGKKLLFMGGEIGQFSEWKDLEQIDWHLLEYDSHRAMQLYTRKLNRLYVSEPALWELDHQPGGFQWIDADNADQSILVYLRRSGRPEETLLVLLNFTPQPYKLFRIGVPGPGTYKEIWNSDDADCGGTGQWRNPRAKRAAPKPWHGQPMSIEIQVAPFGAHLFRWKPSRVEERQPAGEPSGESASAGGPPAVRKRKSRS
ncbi:1,4-alpha-glucan branching protein GlgB [Paenibacillus thermoaerophilus]|uniref:1,4-alpha-glucan branching enzyme GlgB n=1 Tax=Paenibacillus thermoaerophilus TaxID=1215385 RepID=A0ABW2V2E6_9BACL|nr:1,4-alpha-glucan branching protein GlgB [Paenibacillus thermoaerophilus]TMV07395.1 1,4-alpha-glucan branching protein GlgB [Paenibacillus thermoaerophilus]